MDTKALRQKILDLAIRGKLVPQDPKDEPAAVLLERIRAEKMQMVKDGKLKPKDIKNDTIIYKGDDNLHYEKFADGTVKCIEDEIPFEVPEGWCWCRLLSLSIKIGAGSTPTGGAAVYTTSGIKFIRSQNVYDDGLFLDDVAYIPEEINQKKSGSIVKSKDILLNITGGSIGRCALVSDDFDIANVNQHVMIIRLANLELRKYIHSVVIAPYLQEQIISRQVGSGRGGLSAESLSTFLIPLPPLNEQVSINRKLNECISQVLVIADAKCNISNLIIATKSKILDLAIRGKLVPQDPNDEPASVLLERIRSEKEELIKQGKIKRDKKESVIFKGDDNSYYQDLPENWQFTSLREITTPFTLNDGDWILSQNMSNIGDVKLLQLGSIGNMVYIDKGFKYLTKDTFNELSCTEIFSGYLLINRIISDKMCCCIVPNIDGTIITTVDTCWIAPSNASYDIKFLMYQLASPTFQKEVLLKASGTTRRRISKNNLINISLLLPPLAEQKRIVAAIKKIFATLDDISNQVV